jgi:hypothetical protein
MTVKISTEREARWRRKPVADTTVEQGTLTRFLRVVQCSKAHQDTLGGWQLGTGSEGATVGLVA